MCTAVRLTAAALLLAAAAAPVCAQRPDTIRVADSLQARADTTDTVGVSRQDSVGADTIKAPLPAFPVPPIPSAGNGFRWDREAIARSGVFSLDELLARVPGAEAFRTGWLSAPALVAVAGDVSRVRVFLDGIELEGVDPNGGGLLDLSRVQLWTLDEVAVERGADEMRVFLTTWRVERTTTSTRTDVATGDQETNLYRGMFGKRFGRGEVLQLGAQQYGYSGGLTAFGGGDELAIFARAGIARRLWSFDAFLTRSNRSRDAQPPLFGGTELPEQDAVRSDLYARLALGSAGTGAWLHLLAALQRFDQEASGIGAGANPDTGLTNVHYLATAGFARGGFHLSGTGRMRDPEEGDRGMTITGRAAFENRFLTLAARADVRSSDTVSLLEATAALRPTSWISLVGTVARRHGGEPEAEQISARAEAGLRLRSLWLIAGMLTSDTTHLLPSPLLFDAALPAVEDAAAPEGFYGAVRGRLWRDVFVDAQATQWSEAGWLRPRRSAYGFLFVDTRWLSRFPSGSFGFKGSAGVVLRDQVPFPNSSGALHFGTAVREMRLLLEIRLLDGAIFWQQYFHLDPARPELVPGFGLNRQTNIYGVRWQFWN
ncbi:MAG TPA: TonB-dependent receptor [Gemmatimonadaceae bacterium]|nr:TonB-dependent receptor [Gemmatimonadaceae bacterium]